MTPLMGVRQYQGHCHRSRKTPPRRHDAHGEIFEEAGCKISADRNGGRRQDRRTAQVRRMVEIGRCAVLAVIDNPKKHCPRTRTML
jgi:hypothetical protein